MKSILFWIKRYRRELSFLVYSAVFFSLAWMRLKSPDAETPSYVLAGVDIFLGSLLALNVLVAALIRIVRRFRTQKAHSEE